MNTILKGRRSNQPPARLAQKREGKTTWKENVISSSTTS
jgi:hypothetical protein